MGTTSEPVHLRILLVEDDLCLETSVCRVLKKFDDKPLVCWTTTGEDALVHLEKEKFDLIIVDYTLAGMTDGLAIWEYCRSHLPKVPFILMSGLPVESFLSLTKEQSARPKFLPKPFFPQEFKTMVQETLSGLIRKVSV